MYLFLVSTLSDGKPAPQNHTGGDLAMFAKALANSQLMSWHGKIYKFKCWFRLQLDITGYDCFQTRTKQKPK